MRNKLIKKRKDKDKTQKVVADKLGITRAFYSHIETEKRNPTLKLAKKIADYFNEDVDTLFFDKKGNKMYLKDDEHSA